MYMQGQRGYFFSVIISFYTKLECCLKCCRDDRGSVVQGGKVPSKTVRLGVIRKIRIVQASNKCQRNSTMFDFVFFMKL